MGKKEKHNTIIQLCCLSSWIISTAASQNRGYFLERDITVSGVVITGAGCTWDTMLLQREQNDGDILS